tara:strand:- start:110 stop:1240 length:1131 start_codon:yes stop_codon:yes gene_type:complete
MLNVMTIVGTRPELIKMCRVINEFDKNTNHTLVHTGQNYDYELNEIFFKDMKIRRPDFFLNTAGKDSANTVANVISKSSMLMKKLKPDALLIYGDTNSCLAAYSAKRLQIPVFHMEAGNRCFDQRVPEEINRKIIDHISDINLVLTEHARRYLINEGIRPETIIKTESHMKEVLEFYKNKISKSKILKKLNLKSNKYFLVSAHREENIESKVNMKNLIATLSAISKTYLLPIIISTHPRTKSRLEKMGISKIDKNIQFLKPFGFTDYIKLQMNATCVISDSGTITEESSLLNLRSITIRNAHERPEGNDEGTLIMTGLKSNDVLNSIEVIIKHSKENKKLSRIVQDYDTNNVSKKILRVVMSNVEYVNRTVWSKTI